MHYQGIFEVYFDIGRRLSGSGGALEDIEHLLIPNSWIDSSTEWVEFQAAFFNAEVRLFSYLAVRFVFEEGGYMRKTISVSSISANLYPNFGYLIPDLIFMCMIGILFQQELFEVIKARKNGYLKDYLRLFVVAICGATVPGTKFLLESYVHF